MHHSVDVQFETVPDGILIHSRSIARHPIDRICGVFDRSVRAEIYLKRIRDR